VTTFNLADIYQRFGGTYFLLLQGRRVRQERKNCQWYREDRKITGDEAEPMSAVKNECASENGRHLRRRIILK
jgi:hypothetical protein